MFRTVPFSRINTFPPVGMYVVLTCGENIKGVNYEHMILHIYVIILVLILPHADILELLACCQCCSNVVHPILVPIVDWLYIALFHSWDRL
jgi:hypothetical protein